MAFDAATFEIWGACSTGLLIEEISRDAVLSPKSLAATLAAERISTVPDDRVIQPNCRQGARGLPWAQAPPLGGEAVDPKRVAHVLEDQPPERLLHVYGPTETTTFASWHLVTHVPKEASTIPIGRPIANTTMYVLDRNLKPVPPAWPVRFYIGGPGVARGYLHGPELTAAKFVPDPFTLETSGRLYKTGDRARYRADGNVEFLGGWIAR